MVTLLGRAFMQNRWMYRMLLVVVSVAAAAAVVIAPADAAPTNFDIFATGPVGFGCAFGGIFPTACTNFAYAITGDAPAYGTHIGDDARLATGEIATPVFPTFLSNSINGHATVTGSNGDQISIHYCGISPAPLPDATGVGHLDENLTFDITGGTGHFANATGNGHLLTHGNVYFDARPTIVSSEFTGTITMQTHGSKPELLCGAP